MSRLASEATGSEKDRLNLLAVEQWLDAGEAARARNAFRSIPKQSVASLRWLWNTNAAALLLYAGQPDDALSILQPMSRESLTQNRRLRVEALRADAWIQKRDPARAVELMTQRESWLTDRRSIEQNRWRLWQGLLVSEPQVLRAGADDRAGRRGKRLAEPRVSRSVDGTTGHRLGQWRRALARVTFGPSRDVDYRPHAICPII